MNESQINNILQEKQTLEQKYQQLKEYVYENFGIEAYERMLYNLENKNK